MRNNSTPGLDTNCELMRASGLAATAATLRMAAFENGAAGCGADGRSVERRRSTLV
jgi:hypothetical protein